jgi:hypothetical protein
LHVQKNSKEHLYHLSFIIYPLSFSKAALCAALAQHYILAFSFSPAPVPLYLLFWALKV